MGTDSTMIDVLSRIGQWVHDLCTDDIEASAELWHDGLHVWIISHNDNIAHEIYWPWEHLRDQTATQIAASVEKGMSFSLIQLLAQNHPGTHTRQ